jgi:hypothetical protein
MRVICIDTHSPRSDFVPGGPTGITVGAVYDVAEVLQEQYSIINDEMKMARYSQYRFEVVDSTPPLPLRQAFNPLTTKMRMRIRELETQLRNMSNTPKA